ncbi:hypothetical protein GRJ2_001703100 [Grus japonensis]|uniref:Secreted protein n=1 Tax=Grus japonensis TaxID=30415 RepID=A0ABC9X3W5_GRUJA
MLVVSASPRHVMPIALPLLLFPALTNSNQANNKRGFLICLLIHVTVSEQLDNPYTTALDLQWEDNLA